jgi:hypothetical protein
MKYIQMAIDLAAHIGSHVENITFEALRSNDNGAVLWKIYDSECGEDRYVVEGETGELVESFWNSEDEAIENWEK